jgi:hypothetical protein
MTFKRLNHKLTIRHLLLKKIEFSHRPEKVVFLNGIGRRIKILG